MENKMLKACILALLINTTIQAATNDKLRSDSVVIENNKLSDSIIGSNQNTDAINKAGSSGNAVDECQCVAYYLCNQNGTIITDGSQVIDIRMKAESCADALEVCCKLPQNPADVSTPSPRQPDSQENPDKPQPIHGGCGRRNFNGAGFRIIGDEKNEAQFGEFPWMTAVLLLDDVNETTVQHVYKCGGSLIHPRVIMTAAHCVSNVNSSKLFVRVGEWDTQTVNERYPHVNQPVSQIIINEEFSPGSLTNDVALLIVPEPFTLTDHIDTVCLPPQDFIENNAVCAASGWGKDNFGQIGRYQVILKKLNLPMVPHDRCQEKLRETRLGKHFKLHQSFVCAGGESGQDTCTGDGGGPLVCPIPVHIVNPTSPRNNLPQIYHQLGIIAWGIGCGTDIPGVYTNVAHVRHWIDNKMNQLNFDTKFYTYNANPARSQINDNVL